MHREVSAKGAKLERAVPIKIDVLLFHGRGMFPFRDYSFHWYSWENTHQDFTQEDFKNKYFKAGKLDDGTDVIILP